MVSGSRSIIAATCFLLVSVVVQAGNDEFPYGYSVKKLDASVFAQVGEDNIDMQTLEQATRQAVRSEFYHRHPDAEQRTQVRKKVASELIDARLLGMEAMQRDGEGVNIDKAAIEESLASYGKLLAQGGMEIESMQRKRLLKEKRAILLAEAALPVLRQEVEADIVPTKEQLHDFYEKHQDKFTQPSRSKVSMILLKVLPSASSMQWQETFKKAEKIFSRVRQGEDFSSLAMEYSDHESAANGGDLGYLHQGMLVDTLQRTVDRLSMHEVTSPIWTLQGIVMFQLNGRTASHLQPYEAVRSRVRDLWARVRKQQAWRQFVASLRDKYASKVIINQREFGW